MWGCAAVGTQNWGTIELWKHKPWGYTDAGTYNGGAQSFGDMELWGYTAVETQNWGTIEQWKHKPWGYTDAGA